MGYYIRALPWKKSNPKWKLQFVSYKVKDATQSRAKKPKKEWDVDPDRWRSLGLHKLMTIEEATVRVRQINAKDFLKRQEERIHKILAEEKINQKKYYSVLPIEFVEEFEEHFFAQERF